jgi:hypothetical protein
MRGKYLVAFLCNVTVPPQDLEITLDEVQQVKAPIDCVSERDLVSRIQTSNLAVLPDIICGPQNKIYVVVMARYPA